MQKERIPDRELSLRPIGVVRNDVTGEKYHGWAEVISEIVLAPHLAGALEGIEDFSHLEVIFWLDRAQSPAEPRIHPQGREDLPLVGYFATRTPNRPNPLALTVVHLLERRGSLLVVQGLDAYDGTPVLDLKPHMPRLNEVVSVPEWVERLRDERLSGG